MKHKILFILSLFVCGSSWAQLSNDPELDSIYQKIDMSIPDIPAFKSLGLDNSKILIPSTIRDFAFSFDPFYTSGNVSFPRNFGAELAPAHLNNSLNTISNYNNSFGKRWLLNSSLSVATNRDSNRTYLSVGLRSSFINKKHDLKRNYFEMQALDSPQIIKKLYNDIVFAIKDSLRSHVESYRPATDTVLYVAVFKNIDQELKRNPKLSEKIGADVDTLERILGGNKLNFSFSTVSNDDIKNGLDNEINTMVKDVIGKFEAKYWNATRFDVAIAYTAISPDSSAKGAQYYAFDLWATQSLRLSGWGQLLIGINARIPQSDSDFKYNFSASSRLYAGKNKVKGILELQYQRLDQSTLSENLLFSVGAEFKLSSSLWVVAMTGYQSKISGDFNSQIVSNLNLKYGIN